MRHFFGAQVGHRRHVAELPVVLLDTPRDSKMKCFVRVVRRTINWVKQRRALGCPVAPSTMARTAMREVQRLTCGEAPVEPIGRQVQPLSRLVTTPFVTSGEQQRIEPT